MADKTFALLDPPQFVICDDVRIELAGKQTIVGAYPGNIILLAHIPGNVTFHIWTILLPSRAGEMKCAFRIASADGDAVYETELFLDVRAPHALQPLHLFASFNVASPGQFQAQLRVGTEEWLTFGTVTVSSASMPRP